MMSCLFSGNEMPSVGRRWTTIPNRGLTNFVSFPNTSNHSVFVRAVSVDISSLNLITYPVLVFPTPATCTSLVASVFRRAFLICWLATLVGRYRVKVLSATSFSSFLACVLIRRHFGSVFALMFPVASEELVVDWMVFPPATTDAQERVEGSDAEYESSCVRRERTSSCSSRF